MAMYGTMHMYTHEQVEITCSHQLNERRPEGYPVLAIGTLTVYPTRERLERLRDVIDAYLSAHPEADRGSEVLLPAGWWRSDGRLWGPMGLEIARSRYDRFCVACRMHDSPLEERWLLPAMIYRTEGDALAAAQGLISAYLAAHPAEPAGSADKDDSPQVGYPSAVRCDHCNNPTVAFKGHLRCFGCGNSMPLPIPSATDDDGGYVPCQNPACGGELRVATGLWHCATCDGLFPEDEVEDAHAGCDHMGGDCRVLRDRERRAKAQERSGAAR